MPITEEAVVETVQQYLQNKHPGGATLTAIQDGIRHEEDWWYVLVKPDMQPPRRFEYYELLAEAEVELQKEKDLTVLLIPVQPDETTLQL